MSFAEFDLAAITDLPSDFSGEDVNTRLQTLQDNIQFVTAVLQVAREGSALVGWNAVLDSDLPVGTPVYYDSGTETFKASKLQLALVDGRYLASASSECWGIVWKKCSDTVAHLILDGIAAIDMTAPCGEANPTGKWYLSETAGELADEPGGTLVCPVLLGMGNGKILFRPWFADNYPRFFPQVIELSLAIAGTLSAGASTSSITGANNALPGWLPAGNSIFAGTKPAGAIFGYNWKADSNLQNIWPPVYPGESELIIDAGGSLSQGGRVIVSDSSRCVIDANGIWWMTNCNGQLPWDFAAAGVTGQVSCPKSIARRAWLKASYGPNGLVDVTTVNSLKSKTDWLKVTRRDSSLEASTGHLDLTIDADSLVDLTAGDLSAVALKNFTDGKFIGGPVVTTLKSGSASLQITGGTEISSGNRSGQLTLSLATSKDFDLLPLRVQLHGTSTESYNDTIALGLRASTICSFVTEFHIPSSVPAGSKVKFKFWFLAPSTMVIPESLTLEVMSVPAPGDTVDEAVALGSFADTTLTYPGGDTLQANNYVQGVSGEVTVSGGDTIYVRLTRDGTDDGVSVDLHVLKLFGVFI